MNKQFRFLLLIFCIFLFTSPSLAQDRWLNQLSVIVDSIESDNEISEQQRRLYFEQLDSLLHKSPYKGEENAAFYLRFGKLAYEHGAYKQAYFFFEHFLEHENFVELPKEDLAQAHYYLGLLYHWFADYDLALLSYKNALSEIDDEYVDQSVKAGVLRGIGNLYFQWNQLDEAIRYYRNSLVLYQQQTDTSGIAKCYNNMGRVFANKGEYDKALELLESSLNIKRSRDDFSGMFNTYINMGRVFQWQDSVRKARQYFQLAGELAYSLHSPLFLAEVNNYLGNLAYELKDTELAIFYYERSLEYADSSNYQRWMIEGHQALSEIYEESQNFQKSLYHFKAFKVFEDSVFDEDTRFLIDAYRNETLGLKEERQMILKEKTIDRQRWFIAIVALLLFFSLLFVFLMLRQNKLISSKSKKMAKINKELDKRVKERTKTLQMTQYAVDMATDSIFVVKSDGTITYCNEATLFLLGYNREFIRGLKFYEIVKDFSEELWQDYAQRIIQRGSYTIELVFVSQSDDLVTMEVAFNSRAYEENHRIYAFCRNIEERKRNEKLILEEKDKAERSDRLKSAFLANMSHEIRTPLNAIVGFSDLLARDSLQKIKKDQIVDIVKSNSQDLITLINDIIDFSMIEANQLTVDKRLYFIQPILEELIWVYRKRNEERDKKNLEIQLQTPANAGYYALYTDKSRLRQVLINLLDNALKFTQTGYIELGFSLLTQGGRKMMRLYVKDTGPGIAVADQEVIFDRFHKLEAVDKAAFRGTGLGLSISKRLVELLDGEMGVMSEEGKGSVFYIDVPYQYMIETAGTIHQQLSNHSVDIKDATILIVEDDEANYLLLESLLKPTHAKLIHIINGEKALAYIRELGQTLDLVIMDIQLPGINGDDLARECKKLLPKLPIIAQTAYGNKFIGQDLSGLFDKYLYKPIEKNTLIKAIIAVLQHD